jgi:hypothetical protein
MKQTWKRILGVLLALTLTFQAAGFVFAQGEAQLLSDEALASVQEITTPLTEKELRQEFANLHGLFMYDAAPLYSIQYALNVLFSYDALFEKYSTLYKVPRAIVESSVLRELFFLNILDLGVDFFVGAYYRTCNLLGKEVPEDWRWLFPAKESSAAYKDSSTGPGQLYAAHGIADNNFAVENGIIEGRIMDMASWQDRAEMWLKLNQDMDFHIQMVTLQILRLSQVANPKEGCFGMTETQIQWTFARYNTGSITTDHTLYCYKYYQLLDRYYQQQPPILAAE